jgi:signal peptidase II|tara:strand:- start:2641 stop:3123 length:483 start_codon:yes stop_codon:yes gene_type:complete
MSNFLNKNFIINFLIILSIFALDRFSKIYVIFQNEKSLSAELFESKYLNINLIWNEGIAFGLLSFDQKLYYNLLTGLICLITLIILWMVIRTKGLEKLAFMVVFGGSLGNIFDRLYYSSVPDFIDIHFGDFHWFIFNVADIFITLGVLLLIYLEIFLKKT